MATVMSSAAFGAASGSTIVNAAVFTKMAMPEMTRFGYDVRLSAGCIAAAGTLAALIPPSILMVVYAVITEQSIGKLLIAGIVPGILTALIYCGGIYVIARCAAGHRAARQHRLHLEAALRSRSTACTASSSSSRSWWAESTAATFPPPTPARSGAFGAFVIALVKGRLGVKSLVEVLKDAAVTTSVIFIIVVGGIIFARFLTYSGLVDIISEGLLGLGTGKYIYLLGFVLLFLVLGCFIEPIAIMVMTLPIMFPVMVKARLRSDLARRGRGEARRDRRAHAAGGAQRIRGEELLAGAGDARSGIRRRDAVHRPRLPFARALRAVPGDDAVAAQPDERPSNGALQCRC